MADEKPLSPRNGTFEILVRVEVRNQEAIDNVPPDDRFWSYFRAFEEVKYPEENLSRVTNDQFERRIELNFGDRLKRYLVEYFNAPWGINTNEDDFVQVRVPNNRYFYEDRKKLTAVFFRARVTGYSSMKFAVDTAGFDQLASLFENNFDLFFMFFNAYLPQSFAQSIHWQMKPDGLSFVIENAGALQREFVARRVKKSTKGSKGVEQTDDGAGGRFGRYFQQLFVWLVTNLSLVIPVALATFFIFLAYSELKEYRTWLGLKEQALTAREVLIDSRYNEQYERLLKEIADSKAQQEKLLDKLVK